MPSSAKGAVAFHCSVRLFTTVAPVGLATTTWKVVAAPAATPGSAFCVTPALVAVTTTLAVAVAALLTRPMSSAAVAVIVLLMVPLVMTLTVALMLKVRMPPTPSVGTDITGPSTAGHTASPPAAQVKPVCTRKLPSCCVSRTSRAASLPTFCTTIVKTTVAPGTKVSAEALPLTTTSLPEALREPPQAATASTSANASTARSGAAIQFPTRALMVRCVLRKQTGDVIGRGWTTPPQFATECTSKSQTSPLVSGLARLP